MIKGKPLDAVKPDARGHLSLKRWLRPNVPVYLVYVQPDGVITLVPQGVPVPAAVR